MIYVTGDLHGHHDMEKLDETHFPEQHLLTKKDYVIVCGDFSLVWSNSEKVLYWRNWFNSKPFTTLFVDGNHENFDLLNKYEIQNWSGGKVHFISDSIIHLMRGQIFQIGKYKVFTMGGATSVDKEYRIPGVTWWEEEQPSENELIEARENLFKCGYEVDYIISHSASNRIISKMGFAEEDTKLVKLFDEIDENVKFKHWYFGHYHNDKNIDSRHTALYNVVTEITHNGANVNELASHKKML